MSRLSLRLRLSLAFALAMAVVLAVAGAAVYLGVRETLGEQVAASPEAREERDETLGTLLGFLLVGGPLALAAATLGGWWLAGAALRPVEEMRRRAAEISADTTGGRLPVPAADDEIRRLGTTLNEMLDRLDAGLARERRFVADASHELRTPLSLLRAELELALRRERPPEELRAAIASAREEVERLVALAEALLELDRAGAVEPEELDARELLDAVARRFRARAELEGRVLEVAGGGRFAGDRAALERSLASLVDNAFVHGAGRVRLEAAAEGDEIALRVSDEGPGFPESFLPRAFDRFARADEARGSGGAGLGLALVSAVARAHGGRVAAAGSTVALTLPRAGTLRG